MAFHKPLGAAIRVSLFGSREHKRRVIDFLACLDACSEEYGEVGTAADLAIGAIRVIAQLP